jgi:hypothetical protein
MATDLLESFAQLVAARTGVRIGSLGDKRLLDHLRARIKAEAGGNPAAYLALLKSGTAPGRREWDALLPLIMNGGNVLLS